jgi:hypothetical protein
MDTERHSGTAQKTVMMCIAPSRGYYHGPGLRAALRSYCTVRRAVSEGYYTYKLRNVISSVSQFFARVVYKEEKPNKLEI